MDPNRILQRILISKQLVTEMQDVIVVGRISPELSGACYVCQICVTYQQHSHSEIYIACFFSIMKYRIIFRGNSSNGKKIFTVCYERKLLELQWVSNIEMHVEICLSSQTSCQPLIFAEKCINAGIKVCNNLPSNFKRLMNEKIQFKVALKRWLNTHPFYSVNEFLLSKNDS